MNYVIALGLGPVQDFIATARRTRDLWFGSYLLSQASQAAAQALTDGGGELIFPTPATLSSSELERGNVSNKILVRVPGDAEQVRALVTRAIGAAKERVMTLAAEPLAHLHGGRAGAELQLQDLLEVAWAAAPQPDASPAGYAASRAQAEQMMAARKNTRDFSPVRWGSHAPKSHLDGQRESVVGDFPPARRLRFGLREAEELCGPGFVKRTGLRGAADEARFMSTSHVAAQPYLARLSRMDRADVGRSWQRYLDVLDRAGLAQERLSAAVAGDSVLGLHDGRLLYANRLDELTGPEGPDPASMDAARDALQAFLRAHPATSPVFGTVAPDPYYVVFQADGDGMGTLIDLQARLGWAQHSALSDALSLFAGRAGELVRAAQGSLIYAGGDDVLALLPLHTALNCAVQVAGAYRDAMAPFAQPGAPASLSGGLVIAHFLTPLQDTLAHVRTAEKTAKNVSGKDAVAVSLYRRSGSPVTVSGKWTHVAPALSDLGALFAQGAVPSRFAYNVRVLSGELGAQAPDDLAALELQRILKRKRADGGRQALGDGAAQTLTRAARTFAAATERPASGPHGGLRTLSDALIIAHTFARAQAQAGTAPSGEPA